MKRSTIETILAYLNGETVDTAALKNEVTAEFNRMTEKAQHNANIYAQARDVVINALTDTPVTVADLYETIKDSLPSEFSKSKVQYGLLNPWAADVVKHVNAKGANTYTRAQSNG